MSTEFAQLVLAFLNGLAGTKATPMESVYLAFVVHPTNFMDSRIDKALGPKLFLFWCWVLQ